MRGWKLPSTSLVSQQETHVKPGLISTVERLGSIQNREGVEILIKRILLLLIGNDHSVDKNALRFSHREEY